MRHDVQMLQNELLQTYNKWRAQWGNTLQYPTKKAITREWWDKAAVICADTATPPALLFWACYAYRNARPEDMAAPFSPTVFRSSGILRRCVSNYREMMISGLKGMETLHLIRHGNIEEKAPKETSALTRRVAELTLDYFKEKIFVHAHPFRKAKVDTPAAMDSLRYAQAKGNPFLVLATVQTEKLRMLSAYNCHYLMNIMPWLEEAWGLLMPEGWQSWAEGAEKLFVEAPSFWMPIDPWNTPYYVADRKIPTPTHYMHEGVPDPVTDSYLLSIKDRKTNA